MLISVSAISSLALLLLERKGLCTTLRQRLNYKLPSLDERLLGESGFLLALLISEDKELLVLTFAIFFEGNIFVYISLCNFLTNTSLPFKLQLGFLFFPLNISIS